MSEPSASSPASNQPAALPFEPFLSILGSIQAWKVLRVLADGSSLMTNEIAERSGLPNDSVSGQIARLRRAGVVIAPRGKLYEIAPQFLADKTERVLDFGVCLLRLGAANLPTAAN
jgi:DNA-binding transcriptional ArsR family regulator